MLGDLIKTARKNAGLTQQELANRIGINIRNVQKYEANQIRPRQKTLDKIVEVLNLDLNKVASVEDHAKLESEGYLYFPNKFEHLDEYKDLVELFIDTLEYIDKTESRLFRDLALTILRGNLKGDKRKIHDIIEKLYLYPDKPHETISKFQFYENLKMVEELLKQALNELDKED